jgi:hypothetical protein
MVDVIVSLQAQIYRSHLAHEWAMPPVIDWQVTGERTFSILPRQYG